MEFNPVKCEAITINHYKEDLACKGNSAETAQDLVTSQQSSVEL